jgi:hypothetical protein
MVRCERTPLVQQRDEGVVVADAAAHDRELGLLDGCRPEEVQGLVDEVASEVERDAGALLDSGGLLPLPRLGRAPALEGRLEAMHLAEHALADEAGHGEEVAVPATVLEDGERPSDLFRLGDELLRVAQAGHERLVDHEGRTGLERGDALLEVHVRRRREDHEVEVAGPREQRLRAVDDLGVGVVLLRLRPPVGVAGGDEVERERGVGRDERGVEDAPRQAVTDDSGAND